MLNVKDLGKHNECVLCLSPEFVYSHVVSSKLVKRFRISEDILVENIGRKGKRVKADWHRKKVGLFAKHKGCQMCGSRIKYFMVVFHHEGVWRIHPIVVGKNGQHQELTVDHIIPKSRGGSDDITNLTALCRSCNVTKADEIMNVMKESYNIQVLKSYILQFGIMSDEAREQYLNTHRAYMASRYLHEDLKQPGEIDSVEQYLLGLGDIVNQMDLSKVKFRKVKKMIPVLDR